MKERLSFEREMQDLGLHESCVLGDRTLRKGDKGDGVAALQKTLNLFGHVLKVDGNFGPLTEKSVMAFQKAHMLVQDGVVGIMTAKALNSYRLDDQDKSILRGISGFYLS